ncbi:gamma-glutamyl-gamma-aminobutyrate hydrolase family protein [Nonomuraea sediminis]|uniref:gamma-glutamyl-gamma-aminobutyrate hydrolase family protein n=1 Tax=Nonomuraea sediminis TaxID=2835864 RepID=UPI001BDBF572|nr:gamma-glutamyl-gamma-aminobutyrate hydrolase family protein [Nonomuraea sediminis]
MRPRIGITGYSVRAAWGVWDVPAALVPAGYVRAVSAAGGCPVILPLEAAGPDALSCVDGLILSGGPDIAPARYGQAVHPETRSQPERDEAEALLLRLAADADLPVLAVCRGMQLLVVENGGRLHQHLPDVLGTTIHMPRPGSYGRPRATLVPGSRTVGLLGTHVTLACHHHQGVADPGRLRVTATTADGLPEAVEDPGRRFAVGVQWHPEETNDPRLFQGLVAASAAVPALTS